VKLEFHPLANRFPLIEDDEFDRLVEDIRVNGQRDPIVLFEDKILDGRNRYRACLEAGVTPKTRDYDPAMEGPPEAFVISLNAFRRHLTLDQKRDLVIDLLKANPSASDRAIGRQVGVDNKTVGALRKKLADDLKEFSKRFDALGVEAQRQFVESNREVLRKFLTQITPA
jgi:ParB-like chromosome segregation protein Spo0J